MEAECIRRLRHDRPPSWSSIEVSRGSAAWSTISSREALSTSGCSAGSRFLEVDPRPPPPPLRLRKQKLRGGEVLARQSERLEERDLLLRRPPFRFADENVADL